MEIVAVEVHFQLVDTSRVGRAAARICGSRAADAKLASADIGAGPPDPLKVVVAVCVPVVDLVSPAVSADARASDSGSIDIKVGIDGLQKRGQGDSGGRNELHDV